jgi:YgiT-type zinc finger domain-containing protein
MVTMEPNLCPICGGHKEAGRTTFTADLGENLVVVRHVPATICNQCGEEWIDNTTAKQLEVIVDNARKEHRQFEVLSLA